MMKIIYQTPSHFHIYFDFTLRHKEKNSGKEIPNDKDENLEIELGFASPGSLTLDITANRLDVSRG